MDSDDEEHTLSRGSYTVRWVRFDPGLGVERDELKGRFLGRASERAPPFSIRMYTLGGLDRGMRIPEELRELFETCTTERPDEWVEMGPLGSRQAIAAEAMAPYVVHAEMKVPYRSTEIGGCVLMAAANVLQSYDAEAAKKVSESTIKIRTLAEFSSFVQDEVRTWTAENPINRLAREKAEKYMSASRRLEWVLEQEDGIFVVQPLIKYGGNNHVIGLDCSKKLIYDPMEENLLRLQGEVMGLCAGRSEKECVGIGDIRQLKRNQESQVSRKRRKRIRRGHGGSKRKKKMVT